MYIVYRRSDGYVASANAPSVDVWRRRVQGHTMTFEVLGTFGDDTRLFDRFAQEAWNHARGLIMVERMRQPCPQCQATHWTDGCPVKVDRKDEVPRLTLVEVGP